MLCLSLLTFSNITKFLYSFFTISLKYFASCLAKTANLFNESTMFGLNSFFMYGISKFLILFLVYILSLLVLSNFGSSLFSSQYASISSLEHSIKGLINFPLNLRLSLNSLILFLHYHFRYVLLRFCLQILYLQHN